MYSQSFVPGDSSTGDPYGHGTHVAGILAGNGTQVDRPQRELHVSGIAPMPTLINLRVLDANGSGDATRRDCGHRPGHYAQEPVQHPGAELSAWAGR